MTQLQKLSAILTGHPSRVGANNPKAKLSAKDVAYIRRVFKRGHPVYGSQQLADKYGVSQSTIVCIIKMETWV